MVSLQIFRSIQLTEPGEKVAVQLMAVNKVQSASHPCTNFYLPLHTYGGRFVSKLHHTIAKLVRILFMLFWGMHFSFGYTLFIWGMQLFWGMPFQFGCTHFIWVCTFYLGMHFMFGYALFIWVCTFRPSNAHALICTQRRCDRVVPTHMRNSNGMLIHTTEYWIAF